MAPTDIKENKSQSPSKLLIAFKNLIMKLDAWLYSTPHKVLTSEKTLWHFDRFVMVDFMLAIDKLCNFNPLSTNHIKFLIIIMMFGVMDFRNYLLLNSS